eukprot:2522308-Pleurochrysis_carterae.AAC.1
MGRPKASAAVGVPWSARGARTSAPCAPRSTKSPLKTTTSPRPSDGAQSASTCSSESVQPCRSPTTVTTRSALVPPERRSTSVGSFINSAVTLSISLSSVAACSRDPDVRAVTVSIATPVVMLSKSTCKPSSSMQMECAVPSQAGSPRNTEADPTMSWSMPAAPERVLEMRRRPSSSRARPSFCASSLASSAASTSNAA